jgi:hypothetical protein
MITTLAYQKNNSKKRHEWKEGGGFKGEKNMKAGLFYGQLKKIHTIDRLTCNQKSKLPKLLHNKILKDFERNIMLFLKVPY